MDPIAAYDCWLRGVVNMWFGILFVAVATVLNSTGPTRPRHGDKPTKAPRMGRGTDWDIPGN